MPVHFSLYFLTSFTNLIDRVTATAFIFAFFMSFLIFFYAFFNETYPMKPTQNHKPQMFDPTAKMPPVDTASNADANLLHQSTVTLEGMPKVSELQKLQSDNRTARKPFQWQFLLPQYWGIWLGVALILPLIYLPLRYQFKIGHFLGKLLFGLIKSR